MSSHAIFKMNTTQETKPAFRVADSDIIALLELFYYAFTLHHTSLWRHYLSSSNITYSPTTGPDGIDITQRSKLIIWIVVIVQVLFHPVLDIHGVGTEKKSEDG